MVLIGDNQPQRASIDKDTEKKQQTDNLDSRGFGKQAFETSNRTGLRLIPSSSRHTS
jgi:hypothetical protein